MFRSLILSCAASLAVGAGALAADLPSRAAPAPAPIVALQYSWSGFYVGAYAGGLFGSATLSASPQPEPAFGAASFSQKFSANGFAGGAQVGYALQSGPLVYGLEADFQGSSANASSTRVGLPDASGVDFSGWSNTARERLDWFGTVRGRAGYAIDRTLIYATGGLIVGDVKSSSLSTYTVSANPQHIYSGSASGARAGYVVGGGVEYALAANWTARLEGLYFDLGKQTFSNAPLAANAPFAIDNSARLSGEIVRVGLNYKFY
jgi:outer membrane immunogenic protein